MTLLALALIVGASPPAAAVALADGAGQLGDLWRRTAVLSAAAVETVRQAYQHAPAVVAGLAALLVLPPLALIGWLVRPRRARHPARRGDRPAIVVPPARAWIELVGSTQSRREIGNGMIVIGRADDTDLCLADEDAHLYHAAIHASSDAGYVITDLGGADSRGVRVNGAKVASKALADGDLIVIGRCRLAFHAAPRA
jgi:hypothetical protein